VVVVCATGRESDQLRDELRSVVSPETTVLDFPAWETLPHERLSPHAETVARRRSALAELHSAAQGGNSGPLLVVASIRALVQPVNPHIVDISAKSAATGSTSMSLEAWVDYLTQCAYVRVDLVTRRGEYAVRGGIVDVFPPLAEHPVRLDFFGSEIETLQYFAVADQRSLDEPAGDVVIPPVREMLLTDEVRSRARQLQGEYKGFEAMLEKIAEGIPVEGMEALQPLLVPGLVPPSDFFPTDCTVIELSSQKVAARAETLQHTNREFLSAAWEAAAMAGGQAPVDVDSGDFLSHDQLIAAVAPRPWISLDSLDAGDVTTLRPGVAPLPLTQPGSEEVWDFLAERVRAGDAVVCVAAGHGLVERTAQVLGEKDIPHRIDEVMGAEATPGVAIVTQGMVREGFWLPGGGLTVVTERELYGKAVTASRRSGRSLVAKRTRVVDPLALSPGDFVVHDTHGVGKFVELVQREISTGGRAAIKSLREFVVLEFAPSKRGGAPDRLYVPTDQLSQLDHYIGGDSPTLSKMGGSDWAATKGRARKAVREIAVDLVKL
jgi:transcription-repair coupling factor (superfamily II helicase)